MHKLARPDIGSDGSHWLALFDGYSKQSKAMANLVHHWTIDALERNFGDRSLLTRFCTKSETRPKE